MQPVLDSRSGAVQAVLLSVDKQTAREDASLFNDATFTTSDRHTPCCACLLLLTSNMQRLCTSAAPVIATKAAQLGDAVLRCSSEAAVACSAVMAVWALEIAAVLVTRSLELSFAAALAGARGTLDPEGLDEVLQVRSRCGFQKKGTCMSWFWLVTSSLELSFAAALVGARGMLDPEGLDEVLQVRMRQGSRSGNVLLLKAVHACVPCADGCAHRAKVTLSVKGQPRLEV